jgi:hypothetical protein
MIPLHVVASETDGLTTEERLIRIENMVGEIHSAITQIANALAETMPKLSGTMLGRMLGL